MESRTRTNAASPNGARELHADVRFGAFRLDARAGLLYRGLQAQPLRPKTWAVLLYLAQRPGALVTRDELLDAVWPDVAVTPDTLTKSIGELRQVLGDDPSAPRFIATVHRRGFRFVAPTESTAMWQPATARDQPFVGREVELERLAADLTQAHAGVRRIVFITGEAGVGKTSLCDAFVSAVAGTERGDLWIGRANCIEQHGPREPYMSVLSALERLARRSDGERLIALLRRVAPTWLAQMPWLLGEQEAALRETLQTARSDRMLREFAVLVEALTVEVPLLLVLEDLHWSDPATVDLLVKLGSRHEPARLMVIGTFRAAEVAVSDHPLARAVRGMRLRQQCAEVPLHELTASDVERYLAARFPGATPPAGLSARLYRYTDGNALFVTTVVDHLVARGLVRDTAPGWAFSSDLTQADLGVPDDARRMIELQYDGLSPADRELLATASVAGQAFLPEALARARGDEPESVEARCEALATGLRFLRADGGPGSQRFAFSHELHRRAVYDGIAPATRQRLHRRFAEALESLYADNDAPPPAAELATHFERAGDSARAVRYLIAAAEQAQRRFATREAIGDLQAALDVLERLPDAVQRQRTELDVRLRLWPLLRDLHGMASEPVQRNCERALALCDGAGSGAQRFELLYALCHVYGMRADLDLAPRFTAEAVRVAQQLDDETSRRLAESIVLRLGLMQGRFAETRRMGSRLFEEGDFRRALGDTTLSDALIDSVMHYAQALWFLGQTSEAITVADAGLAAALTHCSPAWQGLCLGHRGLTALFCRDGDGAAIAGRRMRDIASGQEFEFCEALAGVLEGGARVLAGDNAGGIAVLNDARLHLAASGSQVLRTILCAFAAEAHLAAGDWNAGLVEVDEGLRVGEATLERLFVPELWRLKGLLVRAAAPPGQRDRTWREVDAALRRAVDEARNAEARSLEVRATTTLATALAAGGQVATAADMVAAVLRDLPLDPANGDVNNARRLLAELSASVSGT